MKRKDIKHPVCQDCPFHKNKPSWCTDRKKYIPRKHDACFMHPDMKAFKEAING